MNNNKQQTTAAGATGTTLLGSTRQKQLAPSNDLIRSFKATTNLAQGLTKERIKIQNDLQKISHGKEQLEELKKQKKVREPILTQEERFSKQSKQEIKGTGFNLQMYQSEKGQVMIEAQRDSRRQRHLDALKESQNLLVNQFFHINKNAKSSQNSSMIALRSEKTRIEKGQKCSFQDLMWKLLKL